MKVNIKNYPDTDSVAYRLGIYTQQKVDVKIDKWDTYSLDETLAHIIHPALVQLRQQSQSYPGDKDIALEAPLDYDTDELRWDWMLGEMIFAFKSKLYDWGEEFTSGVWDMELVDKIEPGQMEMKQGPNHTYKIDSDGMKKYQARINNGFRLFGKYYEHLWD